MSAGDTGLWIFHVGKIGNTRVNQGDFIGMSIEAPRLNPRKLQGSVRVHENGRGETYPP